MKAHYYADGVEKVVFSEGMIRLDLFCFGERPEEGSGGGTGSGGGPGVSTHEVSAQLVMPPAGFLQALEAMQELVERMERAGLLVRRQRNGEAGLERGGVGTGDEVREKDWKENGVARDDVSGREDGMSPNFS